MRRIEWIEQNQKNSMRRVERKECIDKNGTTM